jgi:hypothetical protein
LQLLAPPPVTYPSKRSGRSTACGLRTTSDRSKIRKSRDMHGMDHEPLERRRGGSWRSSHRPQRTLPRRGASAHRAGQHRLAAGRPCRSRMFLIEPMHTSLGATVTRHAPAPTAGSPPWHRARPARTAATFGGALDGGRALPAKERTSRSAAASVGRRHPPGHDEYRRTWRTAASQEGCQVPADDKGKGKETLLATFNV